MEKFVTSPRMLASAGHDRYGLLLAKHFADDPDTCITMLNLKPDITSGVEAVAWQSVENGKEKLAASHGSQKSIMTRLAGSIIDKFAVTVRNSDWFSNMLTSTYRQMLSLIGENPAVYSSHYLALQPGHDGMFTYLVPDVVVHNAALDRTRRTGAQLLIPQKPVRDHILRNNPELSVNIVGDYLPIDIKLSEAIKMRLERQKKILDGECTEYNIVLPLGGSVAEFEEVVEVVRQIDANPIDKWGRRYYLTVLCGDINRPVNACLTATLEDMIQTDGLNVTLVKANTKTQDLDMWYEAMANPQYDTVITRPNEMLTISPALGFRTVLLNPFQIHERHSMEEAMLNAKYSSNLTRFNWLLDTNGRFAGFERGTNISGNYQSSRFWCKAQSLTLH